MKKIEKVLQKSFMNLYSVFYNKKKQSESNLIKLSFSPVTFRKVSLSRFRELLDLSFAFKRL